MPNRPDQLLPEAINAVRLADAFREHTDPNLMEQYRLTKERLDREGQWQYVGTTRADQGKVLSRFDALGHELLKESRELLVRIEADFLARLERGDVKAWAREGSPAAPWREIPASAWSALRLDDVTKGTVKGPGVALFDVRVGPSSILAAPPSPASARAPVPPLPATGAPGRPSHMHLVEAEFRRRRDAGCIETSLNREAAALAAWFKVAYPDKQPVTAKTVANRLREQFREAASMRR